MESIAKNTNIIGINAYRDFQRGKWRRGTWNLFVSENNVVQPGVRSFRKIGAELGAAAFLPDEGGFRHQVAGQNHVAQFVGHPFGERQATLPGGQGSGGGGQAFFVAGDDADLVPHHVFQV